MAQRKKRRSTRNKQQEQYPGWIWMLFGLAIGLSVAFAVYVKDSKQEPGSVAQRQEPASMQDTIDNNGELAAELEVDEEIPEDRFDFYKMLPAFEIVVDDEAPEIDTEKAPTAIDEPGLYLLQAGSFSKHEDADKRRAELGLHGIESRVQRARVNNRDYYRVYIGPIDDLDKLNITRSRLRAAKIDVMRIRLGD